MTNIYATYPEKFLKAVVAYASSSILYKEAAHTNALSPEEVANLFKKGLLLISDSSNYIRPTKLVVGENYATVSYITVGASDIAVETKYYSDGYSVG